MVFSNSNNLQLYFIDFFQVHSNYKNFIFQAYAWSLTFHTATQKNRREVDARRKRWNNWLARIRQPDPHIPWNIVQTHEKFYNDKKIDPQ